MMLKAVPLTSLKSGKLKYKLTKLKANSSQSSPGSTSFLTPITNSPVFVGPGGNDHIEKNDLNETPKKSFGGEENVSACLKPQFDAVNVAKDASDNLQGFAHANAMEVTRTANFGKKAARIGAGGAPEAIKRILESGPELDGEDSECQLIHEENTARLYFKIPDAKASKFDGAKRYCVLQCADISAGDLKVTTKFGSWDSMVARVLIECDGSMFLWRQNVDSEDHTKESSQESILKYEYVILNSCMVKATFAVEFISMVCKMMHLVKVSKTREIIKMKKLQKDRVISNKTKLPSKIREGLPEWVNYIPYRWYSANIRRIIEYALVMYTIVSLLWAVWQLYRHVDFIRSYLKPIVRFIEHYLSIFKSWFQWMDNLFTSLSHYWWNYLKPTLMLLFAAFSPLFQIFRPLKGIVNVIPHLFDPFIQFFHMIYLFIKPIALPIKAFLGIISHFVISMYTTVFTYLVSNPAVANIIQRSREFYVVQLLHEALHGHLDPLKAQVVVIRDLIFKSSRKIYYGIRFILNKTYFMIIFLRREREYSAEGHSLEQHSNEEEKPKQE